jgi:hypothetical protein
MTCVSSVISVVYVQCYQCNVILRPMTCVSSVISVVYVQCYQCSVILRVTQDTQVIGRRITLH